MPALVLNLLGGFEADLGDGPRLLLPTKTGQALLAYLALTPELRHSRDQLAALLWEDRAEPQARTSLRQTLAVLRKAIPSADTPWLCAEGDSIALNRDVLQVDVTAFEELAAEAVLETLARAAALYKGDLLQGFNLRSEAFSEWLGSERARLHERAVQVLARLLALQCEGPDIEAAIATAGRLLSLDPFQEQAHRALMRLHAAHGRQGSALHQYEICRDRLRRELDVAPEPETEDLYREIRAQRSVSPSAPAAESPAPGAHPFADKPSIAVLPFANLSGDADQEYFADGMVEEITTALSRLRWLFVIDRYSSFTYKGRVVDAKQVGRELGVRYLLEGSVRKAGNTVRIAGQLIDASTAAHLWADHFDGRLEDIFDLQDRVTASVIGAIAPKLEQAEIERARRKPTENLDAYDYYIRGRAALQRWTREASDEALSLLYRAIELDPDFASAYGMAAGCYSQRKASGWVTDRAQEVAETARLVRRAAELGRDDAVALSASGFALATVVGDVENGAALIDRALLLNPNLASAWYFSGWAKAWLGDPEAAIERITRALRLSPQYPHVFNMQSAIAYAHFVAGRYAEAMSWAETALRERPDHNSAIRTLAASSALAGRLGEAQKAIAHLRQIDPALRLSDLPERVPFLRPADFARYAEALRKAGLPE